MDIAAEEEEGMTIGLHILVLDSSMLSIQNLFIKGNWGALFTGHIMQNPPLPEGSLLWKLHLSKPRDLLSAPPVVLPLIVLCPSGGSNPLPDGLCLCTCSSLLEIQGRASR